MMQPMSARELHADRMSTWKAKAMEFISDTSTAVMGHLARDRTNATFYGCLSFLVVIIFALFFVGGDEVVELTDAEGSGLLGVTVKNKVPPPDQLQPVPTGVNILIIGDSISRYGYLSLVYFLRWGRWFEPDLEKSNLVNEHSFECPFHNDKFGEFYFQTGRLLQPYELCDCFKPTANDTNVPSDQYIENRYYHDPVLNNTVTFLHAYGHQQSLHGRIPAKDAYDISKWDWHKKEKKLLKHQFSDPVWKYESWHEVLTDYVATLEPTPDVAVFNAGQWMNHFGKTDDSEDFAEALESLGLRKTIWKTTTYRPGGKAMNADTEATDTYMCSLLDDCLDVSWTAMVMDHLYWDDRHFFEPVYRVMNEDLLQHTGYLPVGYAKYDQTKLLKGFGNPIPKPIMNPDDFDDDGDATSGDGED